LFSEMMGMKLETVISYICAETVLGKSIIVNLNYLQLSAGIENPLFTCRDNVNYLDHNWLLHLRDYLLEINGTLQIKNLWTPIKQRQHDVILMQEFQTIGPTNAELKLVNNWRTFFQVSTLAELCNPEGTRIQQCFLNKPHRGKFNKENPSNLRWPSQREPGKRGFALWLKCLRLCFQHHNNGRINHNFGSWVDTNTIRIINEWQFYYQPISGFLFSKQDQGYLYREATSKGKTFARYIAHNPGFMTSALPTDCIPANVRIDKNGMYTATFSTTNSSDYVEMKNKAHVRICI
jgi:hypothetical protein